MIDLDPAPELDFEAAVRRLAEPESAPDARLVRMLSAPSRSESDLWAAEWPGIEPERRKWIANCLYETSEASFEVDFRWLFQALLDDEDASIRALAVDGLWEARDAGLAHRLVSLLSDDLDAHVRSRAAVALGTFVLLGELGELSPTVARSVVTALVDAAADNSEDVEVRRRATESAGFADVPEVRQIISEGAESENESLRAGALRAMGNSANDEWSPHVFVGLAEYLPQLRFEAARAAGELALADAVPMLFDLAECDDIEIRQQAVWALGEIGGRPATRALERLISGTSDPTMVSAIEDALAMVALDSGMLHFPGAPFQTDSQARDLLDEDVTLEVWPGNRDSEQ